MQNVQRGINIINENLQKGEYDEYEEDAKKLEVKTLKKKLINLTERFKQIT